MKAENLAQLASYLKEKRNVLILTGYWCDEIELNGRKLVDYAGEIAQRLKAPVAATGNTVVALKEKGVQAKKKLVAEVINLMRYPEWRDPIMPEKPNVLILIGYPPKIAKALTSGIRDSETVVLGNTLIEEATFSLPDASLKKYKQNLEELIQELGG